MTRFFFAITLVKVIFDRNGVQRLKKKRRRENEKEIVVSYKTFRTSSVCVWRHHVEKSR